MVADEMAAACWPKGPLIAINFSGPPEFLSAVAKRPESDSVQIALELGRLDFVTVALALLAAVISLAAIVAYIEFNRRVSKMAKEEAKKMATTICTDWLAREAPALVKDAVGFQMKAGVGGDQADALALQVDEEGAAR